MKIDIAKALKHTLLAFLMIQACSIPATYSSELLQPLTENQGYLLLNMTIEGAAPSMTVKSYRSAVHEVAQKQLTIDLSKYEKGHHLIPLEEGVYQIAKINVPYFDLPYILDLSESDLWRFRIEAGKVNYFGNLVIDRKRTRQSVNIQLLDRLTTDYEIIFEQYKSVISNHPIIQSGLFPDDYLNHYLQF